MPAAAKVWLVVTPVLVEPSPKFHAYAVIVLPTGAVDAAALNWTAVVVSGAVGEDTKLAVGVAAVTVTVDDVVALAPVLSVTVNATAYIPAVVKIWLVVTPTALEPSPKFHANPSIVVPVGDDDPDALNCTVVTVVGADGENTKLAVGAL